MSRHQIEDEVIYLGSFSDMSMAELQEDMDEEESFMFDLLETDIYLPDIEIVW